MTAPGKLGRKPPIDGRPALRLSQILKAVPDHPLSVDYGAKVPAWPMRLNDRYGTCMAATVANSRLLTTTWLTDRPVNWSDDMVTEFYMTQNPGFPSQDEGMVMQVALEEAHKNGVPELDAEGNRVKAVAFAKVDLSNEAEVDAAVAIFGGVMWGVIVQQAQMSQFSEGQDWDFVGGSPEEGGHAIEGVGYDDGERFITWAEETEFTDSFRTRLADECWVVIWPEHLGTRQFQQGIDVDKLAAAYKSLTGDELPIPEPVPPTPTPTPNPTPDPGAATFQLPSDLEAHVERVAARRGLTAQDWIIDRLRKYFS